jgi:hypothetical protein
MVNPYFFHRYNNIRVAPYVIERPTAYVFWRALILAKMSAGFIGAAAAAATGADATGMSSSSSKLLEVAAGVGFVGTNSSSSAGATAGAEDCDAGACKPAGRKYCPQRSAS